MVTWIIGTLLIIMPHSLSYKSIQSSKSQCCFLVITTFSMLIMIFIIILVSVTINLWIYVLTLIVIFKKDLNEWSNVNRIVTNNNKKTLTKIEVINQNHTPSNLAKEVLETAFENKVTNIVTADNINNNMDSESTLSYNSETSDYSTDSEVVNSNENMKSTDIQSSTGMLKLQHVSSINEISNQENIANALKKEYSTKMSTSATKKENEEFLAFSEEIQKDGKTEHKITEGKSRHRGHKETSNDNSAINEDTSESLIQLKPVVLVCLLNFCFIVTWTPYLTILFIYISICGKEDKVQICYTLEANLFPAVITIGLIDWIINPVIYFYVRNRI